jgi:hypothetical protein
MKVRVIDTAKEFTLYPLSDVHWPEHDHDKLTSWRGAVLGDPHALVTLGGDLFDFARGKYRAHLAAYTADDNSRTPLDEAAYGKIEAMRDFLKPIKNKIIMACVGNHFWRFQNGRVSDQELAILLGRKDAFVGALGLARVRMEKRAAPILALHHDAGRRGGTASADMLAFQHWSHACAADIYCAGHTHRQYAGIFQTRITVDNNKIGDRKLVFVRSGAFLRGYAESVLNPESPFVPDYAEVAMLPPSVMGIISVKVEASPVGKLHFTLQQRTL